MRLKSEEARHAADLRARSDQMLFDSKRVTFAGVLQLADERMDVMSDRFFANIDEVAPGQTFNAVNPRWFEQWRARRAEIALLDPTLAGPLQIVLDRFNEWGNEVGVHYADRGMFHLNRITEAMSELQQAMNESLISMTRNPPDR